MLNSLCSTADVIVTTHNLNFVPQDPKQVIGTKIENGYTQIVKFDTYTTATKSIREALGVRFSDFCNLGITNILVEGKTDRETFQWALSKIKTKATGKYSWENVRNANFLDFGGTAALEGFVKATYEYIRRERATVVVLDGDSAGDKTRKDLQHFFGKKGVPFESNKDFILLPLGFSLEGLFPHEWIIEANTEHPGWFDDFAQDMNQKLTSFTCKGNSKDQLREFLKRKSELEESEEWASSFIHLFESADHALETHAKRLSNNRKGDRFI